MAKIERITIKVNGFTNEVVYIYQMKNTRREFINQSLMAGMALPLMASPFSKSEKRIKEDLYPNNNIPPSGLNILILGGTSFLGPHQIAHALERGHSITTFTRGKTKPTIFTNLYNEIEQLVGDREDNLEALKGRKWDAVIDNSGRKASWTRATAELLKEHVGLYLYISTVSVFYPYYKAGVTEKDELVMKIPEEIADGDEKASYDYGVMKANSEVEARSIFGEDRTIVVRPTFMTGPADRTDRFMYWSTTLAKGGDIIIPGKPKDPVQYIDIRDMADWTIRLIENKSAGTYNGVGPASRMTIPEYVHGAHAAFGTKVNYIEIDDYEFLGSHNLTFQAPWIMDMEKYHGISRVNNDHAIANGLTFRPLATTVRDTYDWWNSQAVDNERREKFNANVNELHNRQEQIIKAWNNRS